MSTEDGTIIVLSLCLSLASVAVAQQEAGFASTALQQEEQRRRAECKEPSLLFIPLSPIPYSHLPADGTHYMCGCH